MNRRISALVGLSAIALLGAGSLSFAAEESKPPMHMHKSDMDHSKKDSEVAAEYKSEATQLREKAEQHRKLAEPGGGDGPGRRQSHPRAPRVRQWGDVVAGAPPRRSRSVPCTAPP